MRPDDWEEHRASKSTAFNMKGSGMTCSKHTSNPKTTQHMTADIAHQVWNYCPVSGHLSWKIQSNVRIAVGQEAGKVNNRGYRQVKFKGKEYRVHRIAWLMVYGEWPIMTIDHINGEKTDNRISNLRDVSQRKNMCNLEIHRNGKLPGTTFLKRLNKWQSSITTSTRGKKKFTYLGLHETELDAHKAYLEALELIR